MGPEWTVWVTGRTVSLVDKRSDGRFSAGELGAAWAHYGHELLVHDSGGPAECLVRRGELLIPRARLDSALEQVRRWVDQVRHDERLDLCRVRLRPAERDRCVQIAGEVPGSSPNHVHIGSSVMFGTPVMFGSGAEPGNAEPVPEPPDQDWGVAVGVLDTGCDPHPWFADREWFAAVPEVLDADDDLDQDRQAGHGTFVSGVVLQNAPGAAVRAHRALSSLGFTDDLAVVDGLRRLRARARRGGERIDVIVLTSGCHTAGDECPPVLRAEIGATGAVLVAAAGNHGSARPFWPAALPEVVAVAAADRDGELAEFSGRGGWVDACAPGVGVVSSFVRLSPGSGARSYGFARWSGTSFAAPQVAAAVATALGRGSGPGEAVRTAVGRYPFER